MSDLNPALHNGIHGTDKDKADKECDVHVRRVQWAGWGSWCGYCVCTRVMLREWPSQGLLYFIRKIVLPTLLSNKFLSFSSIPLWLWFLLDDSNIFCCQIISSQFRTHLPDLVYILPAVPSSAQDDQVCGTGKYTMYSALQGLSVYNSFCWTGAGGSLFISFHIHE